MWTRKVRYRSPENIVAELKQMQEFGINKVNFDDDTFGISKKNIKAINDSIPTNVAVQPPRFISFTTFSSLASRTTVSQV